MATPAATTQTTADDGAGTPLPGARAALVLLLLINLFNYVDRTILAAVLDAIKGDVNASKAAMGALATAFLITYMILAPLFGWIGDRWRRWMIVGAGVILWSLASGGSGLARTYGMLLVMRCLIGVGEAAYGPVAPTLISDLYPLAVRGRVMAWFYAAIPVGSALGYMLGGPFAASGKWHWAFALTLPPGIVLGLWAFFMRDPSRGAADGLRGQARNQRISGAEAYGRLMRNPSYLINTAAMAAMTFAIGGVSVWMPTYLISVKGLSPQAANVGLGGVVVVAGLVATLSGGWAGDVLRRRVAGSYFLVSGVGMVIACPLFLLLLVMPFPAGWVVVFLAVFFLFFNTGPSNTALANVTHPSIRATAFAVNIFLIHAFGDAISPPVIGYLSDRFGMTSAFAAMSGMILLGGILWLAGVRQLPRDSVRASAG